MRRFFRATKLFLAFLLIIAPLCAYMQSGSDSTSTQVVPTPILTDSLQVSVPSTNASDPDSSVVEEKVIDFIDAPVYYDATDSLVYDAVNQKFLLYGNAVVKYQTMTLKAAYIEYSFSTNEACANGLLDSANTLYGIPEFSDKDQSFTQNTMCYNFKTQQGYSHQVITQDGDAYFHSTVAKRHTNEWVHISKGKFTTCEHERPHFYFHLSKAIVVPDDKIVSGPVYMRMDVPMPTVGISVKPKNRKGFGLKVKLPDLITNTPLALPFAWFPNKRTSTHGIILPGYGNQDQLGYFLKEAGYYIPIGETMDTKFLFDIYSRGTWSAQNVTTYKKRYKYSGSFRVSRTVRKVGFEELPDYVKTADFFIRWNHRMDAKARPNSTFSADLNLGTSTNFQNNLNSSQTDFLSNTFQSSVQWSKRWPDSPFNLSVRASHSQNTLTRQVDVQVPSVGFSMSRIYPFSPKGKVGKKWYEKIGVNANASFDNRLSAKEQDINWERLPQLASEMRNGLKYSAQASTSIKTLGGFVTVNPSVSGSAYTTFRYLQVGLTDSLTQKRDTLFGIRNAADWNASVNASTKIFGTFAFRNAKNIQAIRHVMTPSVSLRYTPYSNYNISGFFGEEGELDSYSIWDVAQFRPRTSGESGSVGFALQNNLEMKVRDKKADKEAFKKVKLIENLRLSTSYDLIADSLNLSPIRLTAFTTIAKLVNVNYTATFSPYDRDSTGTLIDTYLWDSQQQFARLTNTNVAVGVRLSSRTLTGTKDTDDVTEEEEEFFEQNANAFVDFTAPWSLNLNYSLNLNQQFSTFSQSDSSVVTQSLLFNGDFNIIQQLKVGFQSGFDLEAQEFTPTTLSLYLDLHCWELNFNWIPNGIRKSYSIQLNVKSSLLKDLKLQRRGNLGQQNLLY